MDLIKLKKFYKGKKILITGNTGFKGIWLNLILLFLGSDVKGFSLKLKKNDNFLFYKLIKKSSKTKTQYGDVLDYNLLNKTTKSFKPEIVFHFAAQSIVIESQKDPRTTFETNVIGTNNIINICKTTKSIKSLIIATSDKCYFNKKAKFFSEKSKLEGNEAYSSSKANTELLVNMYLKNLKSLKFGISTVRAGNVVGGGDFSKYRIIPDIIKCSTKKKIILRNPESVRPWQHVFDVINAYLIIGLFLYKNKKKYSGPYNVGPKNKSFLTVKMLTKILLQDLNKNLKIIIKRNKFKESKYLFLNSKKIINKLKWEPTYNIKKTLKITSDWYKIYTLRKDVYSFSINQIKDFFHYR